MKFNFKGFTKNTKKLHPGFSFTLKGYGRDVGAEEPNNWQTSLHSLKLFPGLEKHSILKLLTYPNSSKDIQRWFLKCKKVK